MPEITTGAAALILTAVLGYLLGSIPFGVVVTKVMGLGDLRQIGSGNIGATNVLRTGNKPAALATLLFDGGKGAVAVLLARAWAGEDPGVARWTCSTCSRSGSPPRPSGASASGSRSRTITSTTWSHDIRVAVRTPFRAHEPKRRPGVADQASPGPPQ